MPIWQSRYDAELNEMLAQEAERQKPVFELKAEKDYWTEAILFISAAMFGGLVWWIWG